LWRATVNSKEDDRMRSLTALAILAAGLGLSACTYVERDRTPPPTVVQPAPTVVQPAPAPPPTVTVRPGY
jgi:hypothetical protein